MITLHIENKEKKEKHLLTDDETGSIAIMDVEPNSDKESWVYEISKILVDHPETWEEHFKNNHCFSIIKMEFDNLTKIKANMEMKTELKDSLIKEYREKLFQLASACVLTLMNI